MSRGPPAGDSGERYKHELSLSTSVACFLRSLALWRSADLLALEQCLFSGCSASTCEASESGGERHRGIASDCLIRAAAGITTDSSDSWSFETDTQPKGYELEQAELKPSPHNQVGFN